MSKNTFDLKDFNVDRETKRILSCSQGNLCIESEYIQSKRQYYARFHSDQCKLCNFTNQCPVKIKNKYSVIRVLNSLKSLTTVNQQQKRSDVESASAIYFDDFILDENGLKYVGESNEVVVPESIDGEIIVKIASEGFARKRVKKVILPNTVKVIGKSAFADCSELTEIVIPDSITNIEAWAFGSCSSLRRIELSDNVIEIGSHAFDECYNLKEVKLPKEIDYIGAYVFSETGLEKIIMSEGIKYLANSLFYNCRNLSEVVLKDGIETIGNYAFGNCVSLKKINLPDSIKKITYASFDGCFSLTSIRIPKNLNEMDETSFSNCINLQRVETNDINKKIAKFDLQNETAKSFGIKGSSLNNKPKYDTIYNMLKNCTIRQIEVLPINTELVEKEEDFVTLLKRGVSLKHIGRYQEAK